MFYLSCLYVQLTTLFLPQVVLQVHCHIFHQIFHLVSFPSRHAGFEAPHILSVRTELLHTVHCTLLVGLFNSFSATSCRFSASIYSCCSFAICDCSWYTSENKARTFGCCITATSLYSLALKYQKTPLAYEVGPGRVNFNRQHCPNTT